MLPAQTISVPKPFDTDTALVLQTLCCAAVTLLNADSAVIALASETHHHIIAADGIGGGEPFTLPRVLNPVSFAQPLFGIFTANTTPAVAKHCPLFNGEIDRLKAAVWVPLRNQHECYGMIAVGYRDNDPELWDTERNSLMRVARGARQALAATFPRVRSASQPGSLPVQRFLI